MLFVEFLFLVKPEKNRRRVLAGFNNALKTFCKSKSTKYIRFYSIRGIEGLLDRNLLLFESEDNPFKDINTVFQKKVVWYKQWRKAGSKKQTYK
ncbi:MAG: hypothetical protein H7Z71_05525 [Moraxellaceae bacterium]|nr:hypothetical protein [Pseudobdellovibrionaceae bacterium]